MHSTRQATLRSIERGISHYWSTTSDPRETVISANLNTAYLLLQGMSFFTKEQAIAYCQKYGWEYEIREPHQQRKTATVHYRNPRYMQYGDNFSVKVKRLSQENEMPASGHLFRRFRQFPSQSRLNQASCICHPRWHTAPQECSAARAPRL